MKYVVDEHGVGKFRVRRAQCSSSAKLLCAKEGNPEVTGSNLPPPFPTNLPGGSSLPGGRRKRSANGGSVSFAVNNTSSGHSVEGLDLVFDPSRATEREQGSNSSDNNFC